MKSFEHYKNSAFLGLNSARKIQTQLLRQHLTYCQTSSPFYQQLFKKHKIIPRHINMDNLEGIPLTDKRCLERSNDAFIAIPQERVVDIMLSSGTTGKPTQFVYSRHDLDRSGP